MGFLDNEESPKKQKQPVIDISDPSLALECSYIKKTALDSGILLKNEEIEDGVVFNGAERTILEAVKCLAENLIRRSKNHRICKGGELTYTKNYFSVFTI